MTDGLQNTEFRVSSRARGVCIGMLLAGAVCITIGFLNDPTREWLAGGDCPGLDGGRDCDP